MGEILSALRDNGFDSSVKKVHSIIDQYNLSTTNLDGFIALRNAYNAGHKTWDILFTLMCYSFNYQFRFNALHQYNSSFGRNRSQYSQSTEERLADCIERLRSIDIVFDAKDFRDCDYSDLDEHDLVYFDPPYLITTGNYNDGKRGFNGWGETDEVDLLALCDRLDAAGVRFSLSNVFECKGKVNARLKKWSDNYHCIPIISNYGNCNYQAKDKDPNRTVEVLISNY